MEGKQGGKEGEGGKERGRKKKEWRETRRRREEVKGEKKEGGARVPYSFSLAQSTSMNFPL